VKAIRTNELEAGMFAACMMDTPNAGGIHVHMQGEIVEVKACDMWGVASETHTTIHIRERGADKWDVKSRTVHNSHIWLVRTIS